MRSPSNAWDAPYSNPRPLRYKEAVLGVIFDRSTQSSKREIYSLGRLDFSPRKPVLPSLAIASPDLGDGNYGVILTGVVAQNGLTENCTAAKLFCSDEDASAELCPRGKCIIGKVSQEDGLWRYRSERLFKSVDVDDPDAPLEYYTKSVLRNNPSFYDGKLVINAPATRSYELIAPMSLGLRSELRRQVAMLAWAKVCRYREACIENYLLEEAGTEIRLAVLSHAHSLGVDWQGFLGYKLEEFFYDDQQSEVLLSSYLDLLDTYRDHILLKEAPRYKPSRLLDFDNEYARPTYSRLPETYRTYDENLVTLDNLDSRLLLKFDLEVGTVAANRRYNKAYAYMPRAITDPEERLALGADPLSEEPLFSPGDSQSWRPYTAEIVPPLTKWSTGGHDKFLSDSKITLDQFYYRVLDPSTCDPAALDWTRQFFGFTDSLWDESWKTEQKRAILLNAFGWFDTELIDEDSGYKTIKGEVCSGYPTSAKQLRWSPNETNENYDRIVWHNPYLSELILEETENETIVIFNPIQALKINLQKWTGLHASKGGLLNILWWISLFGIAGCDITNEIEVGGNADHYITSPSLFRDDRPLGRYSLHYGLKIRDRFDASLSKELSRPIVVSPAQASTPDTALYVNNPLIAGHTQIQDETLLVIPISFKYSRFNRIWDNIRYVLENWSPVATKVRAQYLYPASDYVAAGDVFFEETETCSPWFIDNFDWLDWETECAVDPVVSSAYLDDPEYIENEPDFTP